MTITAVWCRHKDDNIIGIGKEIPWNVPSDVAKFVRIVTGQNVVIGRKTYEALSGRTLPEVQIYVLTSDQNYEVSDAKNHKVVTDLRKFKDFAEDLYVVGGAQVYEQFFVGIPKLFPDIVVDCVYNGEIDFSLVGEKADVSSCVEIMKKNYIKVSADYELDNVVTALYVKRGDFVDQAVLKSLLVDIEG